MQALPASAPQLPPLLLSPRRPARILLAEDDDEMRAMIEAQLLEDGHEVIGVENGIALIRVAQAAEAARRPVDLVITDVRMPGWSGLEALDFLRRNRAATPVIVMTAFGDARVQTVAADLGAAVVLDKPFELEDLRVLVATMVSSRSRAPF
jgi:DNA-binding response OmpR family regulator